MFSTLKGYLAMFFGAIMLGVLAYLKYLRMTNEEQKENIKRLKEELIILDIVSKDEAKKSVFKAMQKERINILKINEDLIDEIEKRAKDEKVNSDNHGFSNVRV